jgi:hypothetical protein
MFDLTAAFLVVDGFISTRLASSYRHVPCDASPHSEHETLFHVGG